MSLVATDKNSNKENTWFTPKEIINAFDVFDLDPCTMSFRPFATAKVHYEYDKGQNGLSMPWCGDVWLNPPYQSTLFGKFTDRFIEHKKGMMLVFGRMDNLHVQNCIKEGAFVYCLRKRVRFIPINNKVKATSPGCGSIFIFFDNKYIDKCLNFDGVLVKSATK